MKPQPKTKVYGNANVTAVVAVHEFELDSQKSIGIPKNLIIEQGEVKVLKCKDVEFHKMLTTISLAYFSLKQYTENKKITEITNELENINNSLDVIIRNNIDCRCNNYMVFQKQTMKTWWHRF